MNTTVANPNRRIRVLYGVIFSICIIIGLRLFYIQVIRYGYYESQAQLSQLKRYEIPAERGTIFALDGDEKVPLVLNELRYNIVADPEIIIDKEETALRMADVLKISKDDIKKSLERESRYEILAKKQTKDIKEKVEKLMAGGDIIGVFAEKTVQRVYPQGILAAQVLGFVDDDSTGRYGVEESLEKDLSGTAGRVRALTDQNGVPLLANGENTQTEPVDGLEVTLTIDVAMQKQAEKILEDGLKAAISNSGSIIIINPNNGQIKALANYPSYNPAEFNKVENAQIFTNPAVSAPLEPGSIMKALTLAAGLDSGAVSRDQTYYDPSFWKIDDATVRNVEEDGGAAMRSMVDILRYSLNTGATWLVMQMGGGELNEKGRSAWHDYLTNHYHLGKTTNIEQGYEEPGYVPDPLEGYGLNIQYANSSFGQGISATPLQMGMAIAAVVNGGTYYQPTLVAGKTDGQGNYTENEPKVVSADIVSPDVSSTIVEFMQVALEKNNLLKQFAREGYIVGGKTGTAEVPNPAGGYYDDRFNGTYVGFVGGNRPEYIIMVRVDEPKIGGYAGTSAAGPIFGYAVNMLIDNFSVQAKSAQ